MWEKKMIENSKNGRIKANKTSTTKKKESKWFRLSPLFSNWVGFFFLSWSCREIFGYLLGEGGAKKKRNKAKSLESIWKLIYGIKEKVHKISAWAEWVGSIHSVRRCVVCVCVSVILSTAKANLLIHAKLQIEDIHNFCTHPNYAACPPLWDKSVTFAFCQTKL